MRGVLLGLVGLVIVAGCVDGRRERTVFVEVVSLPSGRLMLVSIGFKDPVEFEAETPIARNVRADIHCTSGVGPSPSGCEIVAVARVKDGTLAATRVTMCLSDAGDRDCATSNDGTVSVTMTVDLK
jgi:hypothetical protein